jgi:hypothetical protein
MKRKAGTMEARRDMRFRAVGWLLYFSILFLFTTPLCAEELFTRTDELSCGNTVVQAFTTCTEDSHDVDTAVCMEQHFLFTDKKTGASVRLEGSGDPIVDRGFAGGKTRILYNGLTRNWACLTGRAGFYVYVRVTRRIPTDTGYTWDELWDLRGRRLASTKGDSDKIWKRFYRIWDSKDLPTHPLPDYAFVPIQLFKTDRTDSP